MFGPLEALSEQQTGHGPVEKMAWYQVNSKLSESHCLNAFSESCKFYRSQQIIRGNMPSAMFNIYEGIGLLYHAHAIQLLISHLSCCNV